MTGAPDRIRYLLGLPVFGLMLLIARIFPDVIMPSDEDWAQFRYHQDELYRSVQGIVQRYRRDTIGATTIPGLVYVLSIYLCLKGMLS